ncbi:uncharacterized protein K02A2.6-like [Lineus longissimus]|uniref:uncharacterized protein K02A2.6-like n=1 Tax=Lineus longissimus TaxID=88925 RepID=UPI00315C5577
MYVADTLSRAYLPNEGKQTEYEAVNATKTLPIREERLDELRNETVKDDELKVLKETVLKGWPTSIRAVPQRIRHYFSIRDEISAEGDLVFRGLRVIVPASMQKTMCSLVHSSHIGIDGCIGRAREALYWPGMTVEIKRKVSQCAVCREFETKQQKETLVNHEIPERPWQNIGTDLFDFEGKKFLITVDYLSNFWEIDRMKDTKAEAVILKLKNHFARYGSPEKVISDGGPPYDSHEFRRFAKDWDFKHDITDPYHPQSNGKIESAVKSAKKILRKALKSKSDPYLAIIDQRNTPSQGLGNSPVQRLHCRRTRTLLPTRSELLKPETVDWKKTKEDIETSQEKQRHYYDRNAKDLTPLHPGDTVRLQPMRKGEKSWKRAKVTKQLKDRSYEVDTGDRILRRNRVHLKKTEENPPPMEQSVELSQPDMPETENNPTMDNHSDEIQNNQELVRVESHAPGTEPEIRTTRSRKNCT